MTIVINHTPAFVCVTIMTYGRFHGGTIKHVSPWSPLNEVRAT